jgi:hypothetical protein
MIGGFKWKVNLMSFNMRYDVVVLDDDRVCVAFFLACLLITVDLRIWLESVTLVSNVVILHLIETVMIRVGELNLRFGLLSYLISL